MRLRTLEVERLRCVERAVWEPGEGVNIVVGANGAGKTSLLEAIHLAATGRVLKPGSARGAIQHGSERLAVRARFGTGLEQGVVCYERSVSDRVWSLDGETVKSAIAVYERLPVLVISPETHYAILQDAQARRAAVYWLMFHVEPLFLESWQRYQRVLRQRNTALRQRNANYRAFDPGLVQTASVLARMWERLHESLQGRVAAIATDLGLGREPELVVKWGWGAKTLEEALEETRETDERLGYTHAGVHRMDVGLLLDGKPIQEVASHGQQKVIVSAWRLALLGAAAARGRPALLLVDDLAAELDRRRREAFYTMLTEALKDVQVFVTATDGGDFPFPCDMFHVEHGVLSKP